MRVAFIAFLLFGVSACATTAHDETPLVCRVDADLAAYAGQTLTLSGRLFTDFHHGYGLTDDACPDAYLPLGRETSDVVGNRQFFETWHLGRICPTDPLFVTVVGRVGWVKVDERVYPVFITAEYRDVRRSPDSNCPMNYEQLEERSAH